jgi:hypothetical protein
MGDIHDSDVNLLQLSEISKNYQWMIPLALLFNRFHCSRGCPDICPLAGSEDYGSFVVGSRSNDRIFLTQILMIFCFR